MLCTVVCLVYPANIRVCPPKLRRLRARVEDQRRLSETGRMAPKKKRGGSGGSKQKNRKKPQPHARAPESDDDGDDMEKETDGLAPKKKVSFGAQFMLFRVLMLMGVPVDFARRHCRRCHPHHRRPHRRRPPPPPPSAPSPSLRCRPHRRPRPLAAATALSPPPSRLAASLHGPRTRALSPLSTAPRSPSPSVPPSHRVL